MILLKFGLLSNSSFLFLYRFSKTIRFFRLNPELFLCIYAMNLIQKTILILSEVDNSYAWFCLTSQSVFCRFWYGSYLVELGNTEFILWLYFCDHRLHIWVVPYLCSSTSRWIGCILCFPSNHWRIFCWCYNGEVVSYCNHRWNMVDFLPNTQKMKHTTRTRGLSASLAFGEGNPLAIGWFPSQRRHIISGLFFTRMPFKVP